MKIAMLGHKRIPGREGGIEVVVEELATEMAKRGHDVTVYNRKSKKVKKMKGYKGVNIKTIFTLEHKNTDAIVYAFFASICTIFKKYDVVHYHGIGPSVMLLIPKLFRKRIIVTVHGLNYKTPKWKGFGAKVMKLGEKITAKYADEIIVLSYEQQKYFEKKYGRKTIYIPNGVKIQDVMPPKKIKEKYNLNKNGYILFLSRIVPGKGLEYLLDAYRKIDSDLPLIIAGGTEYVDDFYENICCKAKADPRVKMIGFVSGDLLNELYSNAKLFVFPSEAEGMPMCLLEALSFGTNCLVSDIPENKEVGKNYVNTFESMNVDDLKNNIEKCLNDNTYGGADSIKYIKENYSWEKIVDRTLDVYNSKR